MFFSYFFSLAKLSNTFSPLVASAQQGHNIINDLDGVINVLNPIEEQLEKNPAFQGILGTWELEQD